MATGFVGRKSELALLTKRLDTAQASGSGVAVAVQGRRQVGKSRLVQEFCDAAGVPYLYYTAAKGASPVAAVRGFLAELRESALAQNAPAVHAAGGWPDAFRALAAALPDAPSVVVLDEFPWLGEQDAVFDGALQATWDRLLSQRPVLLLLVGSDPPAMDRLTAGSEGPLRGHADSLVLGPLNPAEVGAALSLGAADAIDAHLVSGGLPGIVRAWPAGRPALEFTQGQCADPASPLFCVPETALMAQFPVPDTTRRVIEAVGGGSRTHAAIAAEAGSRMAAIPSGTLSPLLSRLIAGQRVLALDEPLSTRGGKPALYRVADSSLGFYLEIGRAAQEWARRGHPESAAGLVRRRWDSWRARSAEVVVREALSRAAGALPWPQAAAVGGWWTRTFETVIGVVGADRSPGARNVYYAGSIAWLGRPFDNADVGALRRDASFVPGFDPATAGLVAVSLGGFSGDAAARLAVRWGPEEVVAAYPA
jgi:hypothetical protein